MEVSTATGYAFIRLGGYVQSVKLSMAEVDVLLAIARLLDTVEAEQQQKSSAGVSGVIEKAAKRRAKAAGA